MPNIREFSAGNSSITPLETGGRVTAQEASDQQRAGREIGSAIGSSVQAAGDAGVQYAQHRNISAAAPQGSQILLDQTQKWRATIADPNLDLNDPNIGANFIKNSLLPALDDYAKAGWTEGGRAYIQDRSNALIDHFTSMTQADMSSVAGAAVNVNQTKNSTALSATAALDPTSVDTLLGQWHTDIAEAVKTGVNLGPNEIASLKKTELDGATAIARAAATGAIQQNPDGGLNWALGNKNVSQYVSGAELKTLQQYAKFVNSASDTAAKQKLQDDTNTSMNDIIAKGTSIDQATGALTGVNVAATAQALHDLAGKAGVYGDQVRSQLGAYLAAVNRNPAVKYPGDSEVASTIVGSFGTGGQPQSIGDILSLHNAGDINDDQRAALLKLRNFVTNVPATDATRPAEVDTLSQIINKTDNTITDTPDIGAEQGRIAFQVKAINAFVGEPDPAKRAAMLDPKSPTYLGLTSGVPRETLGLAGAKGDFLGKPRPPQPEPAEPKPTGLDVGGPDTVPSAAPGNAAPSVNSDGPTSYNTYKKANPGGDVSGYAKWLSQGGK